MRFLVQIVYICQQSKGYTKVAGERNGEVRSLSFERLKIDCTQGDFTAMFVR